MGLFSFLNKNKQDPAADDGSYVSRDDDDGLSARARAKRASSAGEPAARRGKDARAAADPVLPEKKRARRRLVGAIALALAVAIGLPMILDAEPKPLSNDIDIRLPSRDKAAPLDLPAPVAASESLGEQEEIVDPVAAAPAELAPSRQVSEVRTMTPKPPVKVEPKAPIKPEPKVAKVEPKVEPKLEPKVEPKPAAAKPPAPAAPADNARALAILEDKPAAAPSGQKVIVQVAALASQEKASELQARLRDAGIMSFTQKGSGPSGPLVRVRVGPFAKEEADKVRARLVKMGLSPSVVPN